jgi:aquaporin Z
MDKKLLKKALAEFVGTFFLVFIACGVASIPTSVIGDAGHEIATALSFGLVLLAVVYALGNVSGAHVNPAVSLGVLIENLFKPKEERDFGWKEFGVYVGAQILGSIFACFGLWLIFGRTSGFGANLIQPLIANKKVPEFRALITEIGLTTIFVFVVLTVTSQHKFHKVSGLVIGAALTLVHLFGIPVTGTSVNPARSIGPAIFAGSFSDIAYLQQLWIFIIGPLIGGAIAALLYYVFFVWLKEKEAPAQETCACEGGVCSVDHKPAITAVPPVAVGKPVETKDEAKPAPAAKAESAPAAAPVKEEEEDEKEDGGEMALANESFSERLSKLDKDVQDKYEELKNYCLSYGLHKRLSNIYDTYRLHKVRYVVFAVRGKGLKMHFNLDPKAYVDSPISVKDDSAKAKYVDVPVVFKVKSDLSLKRAKKLIDDTMKKADIEKKA